MKVEHPGRLAVAAAALLAVAAPAAGAQGFGLNEIGSCSVGRAGAGVASPCKDPSSIYWNPAAVADSSQRHFSFLVGVAPIAVNGSFTQDTTLRKFPGDVPTSFPPHVFLNYNGTVGHVRVSRFSVGVGAYVPYGLTSQWPDSFPGRFEAKKASLQSIYIQPNLAFEVVPNRLSIGGGPVFGHSSVELIQSVDLSQQDAPDPAPAGFTLGQLGVPAGTEFARARLKADDWATGFHVGVQAKLTNSFAVGARFLSALKFDYEGTAKFTQVLTGITFPANSPFVNGSGPAVPIDQVVGLEFADGGPLGTQGANTSIKHPEQLQVGLAYTGFTRTTLNLDYNMTKWSDFASLPVNFEGTAPSRTIIEDYKDSHSYRASAEHEFMGTSGASFLNGVTGRLGFNYVKAPAPDLTVTPLLPDMDRYNFGIGAGIPLGGLGALDLGYLRVETKGRRGRIVERDASEVDPAALNSGWYALNANVFSVSLKASF